jgi:cytochrome c biogenesis protein CcmG/thiol:disulfide interchange protein DsbE
MESDCGIEVFCMSNQSDRAKIITIVVLLIAALGILYAVINFNQKDDVVSLETGKPAPDFTLESLDGQKVSLSDYRGKVVLLNVFASWCEPCREEMPAIQQAYETYKDQGLVVLGVNLKEKRVPVKGFADNYGLTFPILLDSEGKVGMDLYKVRPIPTSFFIDREGVLRHMAETPMSYSYIENTVKPLLEAGR